MNNISEKNPAWREPWFWAVFSPLILVAMVCSVLVTFAVRGADDRVYDDYYKQGRMINNQFEAENAAIAYKVKGNIEFKFDHQLVSVNLEGRSNPDDIKVQLSHPVNAESDFTLTLHRLSPGRYQGELPSALNGRWYLILRSVESDTELAWRISTEINFDAASATAFQAHR